MVFIVLHGRYGMVTSSGIVRIVSGSNVPVSIARGSMNGTYVNSVAAECRYPQGRGEPSVLFGWAAQGGDRLSACLSACLSVCLVSPCVCLSGPSVWSVCLLCLSGI